MERFAPRFQRDERDRRSTTEHQDVGPSLEAGHLLYKRTELVCAQDHIRQQVSPHQQPWRNLLLAEVRPLPILFLSYKI